jgi:hypothetical protein
MEEGYVLQGGNGVRITPLEATEDGTYTAKEGQAFNPVTVKAGGGSGGGVLVVNVDTQTMTLDKTWQEINDAQVCVLVSSMSPGMLSVAYVGEIVAVDDYRVYFFAFSASSGGGEVTQLKFSTDSPSGYPIFIAD